MKKLGFGCMRLPLKNKKIGGSVDLERTKEMVDSYLSEGFTYFDTAYMYPPRPSTAWPSPARCSNTARTSAA